MFAFLRGTVAFKGLHSIALDVQGVGYEVHVPDPVYRRLTVHQDVTLITYCHIREDIFQIFGFLKEEEKTLFTMLLDVTGVGPRLALAVMSGLSVPEFGRVVLESDIAAFTRVPGVGKKMAQRIVLEMKAKLGQDAELRTILGESPVADESLEGDDVLAALLALGCTDAEARKAAAKARKELGTDASDEDLVRAALRSMSRV